MLRTLILGGTGWLGSELAQQLVEAGHEVTALARGVARTVPDGVRLVRADRSWPGAYDTVSRSEWDEVIELSYEPAFVEEALAALSAHAAHWTLVSTVSVYANQQQPGANEDAAVHEPRDLGDYGQAKVAAERTSERVLGERLLIARPGLITGPKDPTDRFSYWVSRLALAGAAQVLIPAVQGRYVQVIDVRDVAAWIIDAGQRELQGVVNVVGTPRPLADVLDTAAQVAGFTGELVAAEDQWLQEHQVSYWSGERSLPLWLPREDFGFLQRGNQRYKSAAGPERDMTDLLADILADERARALDRERRAGLDRGQELELLAELARRG